tara:strand:- start:172 stop:387 length:216 start_codon:yes stop_codon:yes gene_type:complete
MSARKKETVVERKRRKNVEYVKRYKATRDRVELYLPQGMRDELRDRIEATGKYDSLQAWFLDVVERVVRRR